MAKSGSREESAGLRSSTAALPGNDGSRRPIEGHGYLIDNSVVQKVSRSAAIKRRFQEITARFPIYSCPPQVLEYCWSARTAGEYAELRRDMELYTPAPITPSHSLILDIQQALWDGGLIRGAGNSDVMIAAYAIANRITILTADHDFEHIARALGDGRLLQEYVAE